MTRAGPGRNYRVKIWGLQRRQRPARPRRGISGAVGTWVGGNGGLSSRPHISLQPGSGISSSLLSVPLSSAFHPENNYPPCTYHSCGIFPCVLSSMIIFGGYKDAISVIFCTAFWDWG